MPTHKNNSFKAFEAERERSNPMVAALASRLVDIRKQNIVKSLSDYQGSSHSQQLVKTFNGVEFIDDARATNLTAVWFALENMNKSCVWINSINDAELITDNFMRNLEGKVKAIVLLSVYSTAVFERFAQLDIPVFAEMNMEDAVRQAFYACEKNYVVLYSPGVHGNEQATYRDRGDKFQEAVAQL